MHCSYSEMQCFEGYELPEGVLFDEKTSKIHYVGGGWHFPDLRPGIGFLRDHPGEPFPFQVAIEKLRKFYADNLPSLPERKPILNSGPVFMTDTCIFFEGSTSKIYWRYDGYYFQKIVWPEEATNQEYANLLAEVCSFLSYRNKKFKDKQATAQSILADLQSQRV